MRSIGLMLCVCASTASAQAGGTLVTTIVERETSAPLAFSTVTVIAMGRPDSVARFTDDAGQTLFAPLPPGRYRVRARELGFAPADTVVDLADSTSRKAVVLKLAAISHRLATVDVEAKRVCRQPGIPDDIASQIHENGARAGLLTDAYPFYYQREEHIGQRLDTVTYYSRKNPRYRVGHMVRRQRGGDIFVLPTLQDLADSGFQRVHCFWFAGREGDEIRIDVEPVASLGDPDIAARFYLDPEHYLVRRATFRVTHADRIDPRLESEVVETRYRELAPLVALPDSIVSTTIMREPWQRGTRTIVEQDRLIAVWDVTGVTSDTSNVQSVADVDDNTSAGTSTRDVHGRLLAADSVPLAGAHVEILGLHMAAVAGDSGQFDLHDVPTGEQTLFIRRIGFRPTTATLPAATRRITIRLPAKSVVTLDPVVVQAQRTAAAYHQIGFDTRRKTERGFFLDVDQIRRIGAPTVLYLAARAPWLRYDRPRGIAAGTASGGSSSVRSLTPQQGLTRAGAGHDEDALGPHIASDSLRVEGDVSCMGVGCAPCLSYYADGQMIRDGNSVHPSLSVRDIQAQYPPDRIAALEAYEPYAVPPAIAAQGGTGCAVIMIWTKKYLGLD